MSDPYSFSIEEQLKLIDLLAARGRFSDAVADCRKVLKTDPQNAVAEPVGLDVGDVSGRVDPRRREALEVARLLVEGSRQLDSSTPGRGLRRDGPIPESGGHGRKRRRAVAKSSGRRIDALEHSDALEAIPCRPALSGDARDSPDRSLRNHCNPKRNEEDGFQTAAALGKLKLELTAFPVTRRPAASALGTRKAARLVAR